MRRVLFVDVIRLCALLQMINGHTLDALLEDGARVGPGFERYRFARGLVSVAFLVVAGISFQLTTLARFEQHRADARAVRRRFTRALQIVLVGYLLQLRSCEAYFDAVRAAGALRSLFRCEVLQCIGLSLLALEALTLVARSARQVALASGLLAVGLFALAPYGERFSQAGGPSFLRALCGHGQGSQFPLLPWAGYVFAGVVVGKLALPESGATGLSRRVGALFGMGALLVVCGHLLRALPAGSAALGRASSLPWFSVFKLGVMCFLLSAAALLTQRVRRLPARLSALGQETLAIFVFHLQVIYAGSFALVKLFGRDLPLMQALGASLLNLMLSVLFAFAWRAFKQYARTAALALRGSLRASAEAQQ